MDIQLLGINHRTAPLELRETLAMDRACVLALLRELFVLDHATHASGSERGTR